MCPAKVLLVDDDDAILRLVQARLNQAGITPDLASSAEDAIEMMGKNLYHVVVADINMPGKSSLRYLLIFMGEMRRHFLGETLNTLQHFCLVGPEVNRHYID